MVELNWEDLTQPPVNEMTYESAYAQLEQVIAALESGSLALQQAINLFERGQSLANYCASLLDEAELKVKQLTDEGLVDFEPQNEG